MKKKEKKRKRLNISLCRRLSKKTRASFKERKKKIFFLSNSQTGTIRRKRHGFILAELIQTGGGYSLIILIWRSVICRSFAEKDYVDDLEMITELFLVPLRASKIVNKVTHRLIRFHRLILLLNHLCFKEEADKVFGNLPHLIPINRQLLDQLKVLSLVRFSFFLIFSLAGTSGARSRKAASGSVV